MNRLLRIAVPIESGSPERQTVTPSALCSGSHWEEAPPGDAGGEVAGEGVGGSKSYPLRTGRRQFVFILNHANIFPD